MSERRPRSRAALHQRSDSETNELPASASIHTLPSNGPHKAVSPCNPTTFTTAANQQYPPNKNTALSSHDRLRQSDSLESLPPIPPLKIKKKISDITVASEPSKLYAPGEHRCSSSNSGTLIASSSATPTQPPKAQTFPRSILKKPQRTELSPRPELPPYTTEEYRQKTSSWVGRSSNSPSPNRVRMNAPTLRIVGDEEEEDTEDNENFQTIWSSESASRGGRNGDFSMSHSSSGATQTIPSSKRSSTPMSRPPSSGRLFPAWARYFYGRRGGRGLSVIEPDRESRPGSSHGSQEIGIAVFNPPGHLQRHTSDDSLEISEVTPPRAVYNPYGSRRRASPSSIPGIDWIGSRTRDLENATTWSLPHLDHTPLTRFENIDRQLILFCLGFILPLCWIIAAFLPLPIPRGSSRSVAPAAIDIESASNWTVDVQRRYENARWWRRINRILAVVGFCVIGAIIALVIVATRAS